jgi:hypothetical protein
MLRQINKEIRIMDTFCSDDVKEIASAMLKVQAEINPAIKDSSNSFAGSCYSSLNSVVTASREALLNNVVWVVQYPVPVESGHLGLVTSLKSGKKFYTPYLNNFHLCIWV